MLSITVVPLYLADGEPDPLISDLLLKKAAELVLPKSTNMIYTPLELCCNGKK